MKVENRYSVPARTMKAAARNRCPRLYFSDRCISRISATTKSAISVQNRMLIGVRARASPSWPRTMMSANRITT